MEVLGPRIVDIVDIVLVSGLVIAAVLWVRTTRAGRVATGLLILTGVYLTARAIGLPLLSGLFEGSLAVFVLIVVVLFQEEIRRLFEGVAALPLQRDERASPRLANLLAETVFALARSRVGALIVLTRKMAIDRHLDGGIELDGKVSRALLESLFDASSIGHDGACVIRGDRVSRFGVHLPLSAHFEELGARGTRHSAALGLSELSDARCLVVSEERGEVALVEQGRLRVIGSPEELVALLAEPSPPAEGPTPVAAVVDTVTSNLPVAIFVTFLVVGLWYVFVAGSIVEERTLDLPVGFEGLPAELELASVSPPRVAVTFRAPRRAFQLSGDDGYEVRVDAGLASLGRRTFGLRHGDVRRPAGVELVAIEPDQVRISLEKRSEPAP